MMCRYFSCPNRATQKCEECGVFMCEDELAAHGTLHPDHHLTPQPRDEVRN